MALEDFERELAESQQDRSKRKRDRSRSPGHEKDRSRHHHRHHHRSSRHDEGRDSGRQAEHREHREHREDREHKRSRADGEESRSHRHREHRDRDRSDRDSRRVRDHVEDTDNLIEKEALTAPPGEETLDSRVGRDSKSEIKRDSWMEAPSALDVDYVQRQKKTSPPPGHVKATEAEHKLKIHENEINHHLRDLGSGEDLTGIPDGPSQHEVDYTFGDAGSAWRMTKLRGVYHVAKETGKSVEDVAVERFGDLRAFDDAREEEVEMDRRKTYGKGYVGKIKPSGEFFEERKLNLGIHRERKNPDDESEDEFELAQGKVIKEKEAPLTTVVLDQTSLNKLKAQMMKAKIMGGPTAARLEAEYNAAMAASANSPSSGVLVLNKMESRMLAGSRKGEVNAVNNTRGRERGTVVENEDMSIEDMIRQERRTRGQFSNEGKNFAERIAKDAKFTNDLDYMDENAVKLAKHVQKSDINLRNVAIEDYQKMKRTLDTCPLCHHEDTGIPPQAPVVSLATRVYLTLPTAPEITPYGRCASIIPIQHRFNLLECDDDEWEEIRNFMKSLTRFYHAQKPSMSVIFYENAAHQGRKRHTSLEAVPLPLNLGETAPAFFKEAILSADEEWTQHKKLIDTYAKATTGGLGKQAFRRSMVSELPYFHVWFSLDGGLGHVVEDSNRWPKGDLFAREIIGGMLDVGAEIIKKQGRWSKGDAVMEKRVREFRKGWEKWDWTSVLMDAQ